MKSIFYWMLCIPCAAVAQNVGIGTSTPTGPLSFANNLGNKIVLWGDGGTNHYGMGVQSGLLQIYADLTSSAVAIGHGRSSAFVERFRVQGNGNIGVGTPSPAVRLDIAGTDGWNLIDGEGDLRIGNAATRLKFGVALGGGGIGAANIMQQGGIGVLNLGAAGKYQVSLVGSGDYINLTNINGGLRINNNAGTAGQVLTSGGAGVAPYWSTPAASNAAFNVVVQTATSPDLVSGGGDVDLPGVTANFTLTSPSRVVFHYRARIWNRSCFACADRRTFIILKQLITGGTNVVNDLPVYTPNDQFADGVSGPVAVDLPAGSHSFKLSIGSSIYGTATVYAIQGRLSWQVFPQ
ncbi:MAG TPA: hypothetical protein PKD90_03965 [Phnomibacter sp.]|nr:hypothetical protein [Phnomibacter sp.]